MKKASWSEKYRHYKRAPNLHYLARSGWVLWLNTDVFLYKSLWENYPLVPLYCDLRDCFTDGFMDSVTSFSLIEHSIIFIFKIMSLTTKHKSGKRLFMSFIYSLWSCDRIISSSEQTCLWYVCLCAWMRKVASFSDIFYTILKDQNITWSHL